MHLQARVASAKTSKTKKNTGRRDHEKRRLPAPMGRDIPADGVSDRASDGDRDIKIRHDPPPDRKRERIGDDGGCSRPISAFAYSDEKTHGKQKCERGCQAGGGSCRAPEDDAKTNKHPA